jgi:hypothetical protein
MDKVDFGCDFCANERNRPYHMTQLATNEEGLFLLQCPRCEALYEDSYGFTPIRRLTKDEAERVFPEAMWPDES